MNTGTPAISNAEIQLANILRRQVNGGGKETAITTAEQMIQDLSARIKALDAKSSELEMSIKSLTDEARAQPRRANGFCWSYYAVQKLVSIQLPDPVGQLRAAAENEEAE